MIKTGGTVRVSEREKSKQRKKGSGYRFKIYKNECRVRKEGKWKGKWERNEGTRPAARKKAIKEGA